MRILYVVGVVLVLLGAVVTIGTFLGFDFPKDDCLLSKMLLVAGATLLLISGQAKRSS